MKKNIFEKRFDLCLLICLFVVSGTLYYIGIVNTLDEYTSDHAYYAIAGKDIMSGNILLSGWYGATNNFYFMALIYGLLGRFLGYKISLIYLVSSIVWASFTTTVASISIECNKTQSKWKKYFNTFFVVVLCFSSCYVLQENKIFAGCHLDVLLISVPFIWYSCKSIEENIIQHKGIIFFNSVLLLLAIFSDELVMYFVVLPLVLVYFLNYIIGDVKKRKVTLFNLFLVIGIAVIEKIIDKILVSVGGIQLVWKSNSISFVSSKDIFERIEYFIEEICYLFNADVFSRPVSVTSIIPLLNVILLIGIFILIILNIRDLKRRVMNQFWMIVILLQSGVLLFTDYISLAQGVSYSTRIMYYIFMAILILLSQTSVENVLKRVEIKVSTEKVLSIFCVLLIVILVINFSNVKMTDKADIDNKYERVAKVLEENGLTHGYGTFWLANATTLASECEIYVSPACNPKDFSKFQWLSFDTSRWDYANFVLVDDGCWDGVTRETIIDSIGMPNDEIQVDNITIMIWDKNIMPYVNDSGSELSLDYWWSVEPAEESKSIIVNNKHFYSWFEPREDGSFMSLGEGMLVYGPFKELDAGLYDIIYEYSYEEDQVENKVIGYVDIFSDEEKLDYKRTDMLSGNKSVIIENIQVMEGCRDVELRAYAYEPGIIIDKITIQKK